MCHARKVYKKGILRNFSAEDKQKIASARTKLTEWCHQLNSAVIDGRPARGYIRVVSFTSITGGMS